MSTSPLSPEDGRAAADPHQELIRDHSDAALAPFLTKVERAIAARVDARLAGVTLVPAPRARPPARRIVRNALVLGGGALLVAAALGLQASQTHQFGPAHMQVVPVPRPVPMPYVRYDPGSRHRRQIVLIPGAVVHHGGSGR